MPYASADAQRESQRKYRERRRKDPNWAAVERTRAREWLRSQPREYHDVRNRKRVLKRYGMTISDYDRMAAEQHGKCAICGDAPERLVVDHSHVDGSLRRLLCHPCNCGIGLFRERPDLLAAAIRYLENHL